MCEIVWIYKSGTSAKVWGYDFFTGEAGHTVHYYWGSAGRPMQALTKKTIDYDTYWGAFDAVHNKIREKEAKGYQRIPNHVYFGAVDNFWDAIEEGIKYEPLERKAT